MSSTLTGPVALWAIAFVLTAATAVYQRLTGPTYPIGGTSRVAGTDVRYRFARSHGGPSDHRVTLETSLDVSLVSLEWRRYNTGEVWTSVLMTRDGAVVYADLPNQPPAGKLEYIVRISGERDTTVLPGTGPVVIRFKGDVPPWVLVPHVLVMFLSMLMSARAGLEVLRYDEQRKRRMKIYTGWVVGLVAAGGLILGPVVQKYAFDAYWTGWPAGADLTDNKTLVVFLCWLAAWLSFSRSRRPERWVLSAAAATLLVFLIPHSMLGSELDYRAIESPGGSSP